MNFENWIPIIYEPKTNKKEKEKKRSQMKQLRLNRTKYSRMALLHTTNSKKRRQWRIKTINSSTFPATKWILDLKKETASAKWRRVKKKKKKKNQIVVRFLGFCSTSSCHLISQPSTITFRSNSSFFFLSIIQTFLASILSLNFSQGLENASFDALKLLEMDFGELSFNAFVKDINEIGMCLVDEKVRETQK